MTVKWLQSALDKLAQIADYIALDNPVGVKSFVQEIRKKSNLLADFPIVGRAGRVLGTRVLRFAERDQVVVEFQAPYLRRSIRAVHLLSSSEFQLPSGAEFTCVAASN